MSTVVYNCPCCGAPLAYSGESGKLECSACANSYDIEALEAMKAPEDHGGVHFDMTMQSFDGEEAAQMQAYICESCGAELMTQETTTATECPYCGSPTVLPNRIEGGVKPEKVVPFVVTKEEAQRQFEDYFKGKRLLPNVFLNTRNRISEMRRLFVPYWLFDCGAYGDIAYDATKRNTYREGDWEITETEHYAVRRAGSMFFEGIPVDGSRKLDDAITESLEPYDMSAAVPFAPAVLAGAMADHADVDAKECEERVSMRVEQTVKDTLRSTVVGYSSVSARGHEIHTTEGRVTPVLMPVWLITTEKEGTVYTFAINGQTGKLTCDVPADVKKSWLWGGGVFAGVFALAALVLLYAEMFAGFYIIAAALLALIAAFVVVSVLQGELKQADFQRAAGDYKREDSFALDVKTDYYLHTTVTRRKIERDDKK